MKRKEIDALGGTGACYNKLISEVSPIGKILSVGDSARPHAILNMPYFRENKDKIDSQGLNIDKKHCGTYNHFTVHHGDGNTMTQYKDEEFDCVLSFMMMEHNPKFWLSLSEMKRVLKKGGLLIVAVPGFHKSCQMPAYEDSLDKYPMSTVYGLHGHPDCYRFSPHFLMYVVFEDFAEQKVYDVLRPPRLVGIGYK